ncbi:MAG: transposase family protein [bacterium]|nr:transposase family protein [bacterium]
MYNLFKRDRVSTRTSHPVGKRGGIRDKKVEVTEADEVWHLDVAGPFTNKDGRKCWGRVVVDAYSRFLVRLKVVESLETQVVLDHLQSLFGQYGTPKRIVTDTATTFRSTWENEQHRFSKRFAEYGIEHQRIPSYDSEANGNAEAAVNITKKEAILPCVQEHPDWIVQTRQATLDRVQGYDNFDRLHGGIGWQTPWNRYSGHDERPKQLEDLFFIQEPILEFQFC